MTVFFANKVFDILVDLGGASPHQREDFIFIHCHDEPTREWRFMGKLGYGGKYRSIRNTVDCYSEDENEFRLDIIKQMNKKLSEIKKPIIYIDMDGVVADFDGEIKKVHPNLYEHEDGDYRSKVIDEVVEADVNLFLRLQPMTGAIEAVKVLQDDFEVYFLSTPMWNVPHSFTDKRLWIEKHFGELAKKRLILTHRKDLNIGDYLVDDRLKNGAAEFKGKHIHFGTKEFPDWNAVIKFLYKLT